MKTLILILLSHLGIFGMSTIAQSPITFISLTDNTAPLVTYTGIKGAGLRQADNVLRSSWDSTGSNFTVKYNADPTRNIKNVAQFTVNGLTTNVVRAPSNSIVKLRRKANNYVNATRVHYNFWASYSTIPAVGVNTGTFNFTAPEVLNPEDAFLLNNITSGYDNIFENTINNLHASNIERLDFIIPDGLTPVLPEDLINSGVAVFDRGSGDPFKVSAITSVNANNDPLTYGPLVGVTAANFGGTLLSSDFNFCIITKDPKFLNQSRPSSGDRQNLRGVYISLADLGITINQKFYGYSVFGNDVTTAAADWNTYPNNTSSGSGLDPVNVMGLYKSPLSLLAIPLSFSATVVSNTVKLEFKIYNKISNDFVVVERSVDGVNFIEIGRIDVPGIGDYNFTDQHPFEGNNLYRLKLVEKDGTAGHTVIRKVNLAKNPELRTYPNPASNTFKIEIPTTWQREKLHIQLCDLAGRQYQSRTVAAGLAFISLDISMLPVGVYVLKLTNTGNGNVYHQKLLVSR